MGVYIYILIKGNIWAKTNRNFAFNDLVMNLSKSRHCLIMYTLGMWGHKMCRTKFCICVHNFGVNFLSKEDGENLLNTIKQDYTDTKDWLGKYLYVLAIDWTYAYRYVDISMLDYNNEALERFQQKILARNQFSLHK